MDHNRSQFIGRFTDAPKKLEKDDKIGASFTVASSYRYKNGEKDVEISTFMNSVVWGKLAEITLKFCKKGSQVYVAGRLQQETYQKEDGTKRVTYKLIVNELISFDKKETVENSPEDISDFEGFEMVEKKSSYEPEISIESVPF